MSDTRNIEPRSTFVAISVAVNVDLRTLDPTGARRPPKYLYIGVGGDLMAVSTHVPVDGGSTTPIEGNVAFIALMPGFMPIAPLKLIAIGTTVSSVVGVW